MVAGNAPRTDKSLKKYKRLEVNRMLSLRKREKIGISSWWPKQTAPTLCYVSVGADSVARFEITKLEDVWLDYSHVGPGDRGYDFVENRVAEQYRLPRVELAVDGAASLKRFSSYPVAFPSEPPTDSPDESEDD
jgi:hypothetical protein